MTQGIRAEVTAQETLVVAVLPGSINVVLGYLVQHLQSELAGYLVQFARNARWSEGIGRVRPQHDSVIKR